MFLIGLCLKEVPTELVHCPTRSAGQSVQDSQIQADQMSLGRWQPEIVVISLVKIAIGPDSEVSLPRASDSWLGPIVGRLSPIAR